MCALTSSRLDDFYCNDNNFFGLGGGGEEEAGNFGGEASTPQIP